MEKAIRFDLEDESTCSVMPARFAHDADVVVVRRCRAKDGEGTKAVRSFCQRGQPVEEVPIERPIERKLARAPKGRPRVVVRADVVTVSTRDRAVACVKVRSHLERRGRPHIIRKNRVQCAPQSRRIPALRKADADGLSSRVHAGVGPPGAECRDRRATQSLECLLHDPLNGALVGLPLPSLEACAVVVQNELHGALGHCTKTTRGRRRVKQFTARPHAWKRLTLLDVGDHICQRVFRCRPAAAPPPLTRCRRARSLRSPTRSPLPRT